MKKILIALIFATGLGHATTAWTQDQKNGPQLTIKKGTTYDFGSIPETDAGVDHIYTFKNTGTEPLIIQNVRPACGCTIPDWPKEPILPGKSGKIKLHYITKGRPGAFIKSAFVVSNIPGNPLELTIKGTVQAADKGNATTSEVKKEEKN